MQISSFCPDPGATEDAINQARDALHSHLSSLKKSQKETTDYTDEELLMEEKEFDQDFSGTTSASHTIPEKLSESSQVVYNSLSSLDFSSYSENIIWLLFIMY